MRLPFASLILALLAPLSGAATLLRTAPTATGVSSVDLSAIGTTNWAVWDSRSNPDSTPSPDFHMGSGTTGLISGISRTTGSGVRGTENTGSYPSGVFTWSNGNNNTVPAQITGMFTTTDQTVAGVQFTITELPVLTDGQYYQINLYGSAYNGTAQVTATLGALTQSITGTATGGTKNIDLYQFLYNPDNQNDVLTLSSILFVDDGDSAHALINAVAISIVPEPSSALIAGFGILGLFGIRRR